MRKVLIGNEEINLLTQEDMIICEDNLRELTKNLAELKSGNSRVADYKVNLLGSVVSHLSAAQKWDLELKHTAFLH